MPKNTNSVLSKEVASKSVTGSLLRRTKRRAIRAGLKVQDSYTRGDAQKMRQFLAGMKEATPEKVGPTKAQRRSKLRGGFTEGQTPSGATQGGLGQYSAAGRASQGIGTAVSAKGGKKKGRKKNRTFFMSG